MPHRTDAAVRIVACLLLFAAGCAPFGRRDPAPGQVTGRITPVKTSDLAPPKPLPNVPALAINTPPKAAADDVQPVAHQAPPAPADAPAPPPAGESDPLRRLYRDAAAGYAKLPCYIARLRRREVVQGRAKPEEVLVFKFREKPYSVHFKWLGDEGKGREVVYVRGQGDDKLHVLTAAGDIPFAPAGKRMDLAADSLLVRSASRYPITEAGIGNMIARFGRLLEALRAGESGLTVKYLGRVARPEYPVPLEGVECLFPPNHEPEIPDGGRRLVYFDPATHFPVVSLTYDPTGREVDFYCFDRFQLDVKLDDDDFNPDKLWTVPARK
ncbi:MAG TPA: DUF1571 domain-containing protein [Gemmataceae bacterium]|jgi:hypothetical protein